MQKDKKILIVGAGPVGCVAAEILSNKGFNINITESRNHIAGNCYDFKNKYGVLVHKYGPHYFRTKSKTLLNYLSNFTKWIPGDYNVNSFVNKDFYEFPINLNTINKFFKKNFLEKDAKKFIESLSIKSYKKKNFENYLKSKIGIELYEKFYKNYSIKQWGIDPRHLSESVAKRVPIRYNNQTSYINAKYKFMPKDGFTKMFSNMLLNKRINIQLKSKYKYSTDDHNYYDYILYTGPIDTFFNYKFGYLGWRSLQFKFETFKKNFKQHCLQINYPNDFKFTRTVEYKYVTKQKSKYTTISKEFPMSKGKPYYPRSTIEDKILLKKYIKERKKLENKGVYFAGRLADYKYINTDEAIEIGLKVAKKILKEDKKKSEKKFIKLK
jgi:UDP-galactopyranose mutase